MKRSYRRDVAAEEASAKTKGSAGMSRPVSVLAAMAALPLLLGPVITAAPVDAAVAQSQVTSQNPANQTPNLVDDRAIPGGPKVYAFAPGKTTYVGGLFSKIRQAKPKSATFSRTNLLAFDTASGAVQAGFEPRVNGPVYGLVGVDDDVVAAGEFSSVNGKSHRGLVKLRPDGTVDESFQPALNGPAYQVVPYDGYLVVAGRFTSAHGATRRGLTSLDPRTGAVTGDLTVGVTGSISDYAGSVGVMHVALDTAHGRIVVTGNFTEVGPASTRRRGIAMVRLGGGGTLSPWYSPHFDYGCRDRFPAYLRGVDFSPDGEHVNVAATGGGVGFPALCDSLSQFSAEESNHKTAEWINKTGSDSLYAVQNTGSAVYTCGHERWLDAKVYRDDKPVHRGSVDRPGIAAVDPATGRALAWNPGRSRGTPGCQELLATSTGLWVGSGEPYLGGETHFGIGFLPR